MLCILISKVYFIKQEAHWLHKNYLHKISLDLVITNWLNQIKLEGRILNSFLKVSHVEIEDTKDCYLAQKIIYLSKFQIWVKGVLWENIFCRSFWNSWSAEGTNSKLWIVLEEYLEYLENT